ncbi:hypothetical protein ASPBRDRAFT_284941 [Aspergillus brasiliensis CBS 101740]|uniref:Actin-like ATPase domain-containing protein n=1 Tax=Aspergillus brasiliensis (strain CBS 101740 / IMI 381727 / IBT 21946) TaxID=767769 RepID=A0A1L9UDC3_ASPBC|nr:hypothetical protein ASPBRDRAFT_284941 [Aspergillus brasiliensis CBS 101740]
MDDQPRLVVGVDFGVTKSVVTYYYPNHRVIKEWCPNAHNSIIPSRVSYDPHTRRLLGWGHNVSRKDDHLVLLKLQVAGTPSAQPAVDQGMFGNAKVPGAGRNRIPPLHAIRDFLQALGNEFRNDKNVLRKIGLDRFPPTNWHFAMPDCWTFDGERMMRDAIAAAGFGTGLDQVFYTSEAKAAAIRVASHLVERRWGQVGDSVLVCDLGGATCDYTAFRVARMPNQLHQVLFHPLNAKSMMKHASHMVETSLIGHIRTVLHLPCKTGQPAAVSWDGAIEAKHGFSGHEEPVVDLPFTQQYKNQSRFTPFIQFNEQTNAFTFSRDSLVKAFDPVVGSITRAIMDHIPSWNVTKVVLVGGFSNSAYLRKEVERRLADIDAAERPKLDYLEGNDAITAVSYGLTLRGSMVSEHVEYQSEWGYELAVPIVEMLATGLSPPRKHVFRAIDSGQKERYRGEVHFWLAVEAEQRVQSILIRRFTKTPNRVQVIGEIEPCIPDNARRGVYRPPGAEEISWYECLASWTIYGDVRERMEWKLTIRTDNTWMEAGTADHLVTDMSPWH